MIPNFAVIEGLSGRAEILYIGSHGGTEKQLVLAEGLKFEEVFCGKLRRYFSWENFGDFLKIPVGVIQSLVKLWRFKPQVVFSKGGYVSVPVCVAAFVLRIPIIVHESDLRPGLANRIVFKLAKKVCLSFEESRRFYDQAKVVVTGTPIRSRVLNGDKNVAKDVSGLKGERPVLLIMGGSQGAAQINALVEEILPELLERFEVIHMRGKGNLRADLESEGYRQFEFLARELCDFYALADIVVSRGGANSLAELAILKKKAVILPLGTAASRGDQIENAELYGPKMGWPVLIGKVSEKELLEAIDLMDKGRVSDFALKNAAAELADLIVKMAK